MCDLQRLRPACAYAQSVQSLCSSLVYSMSVKLLTEHLLEVLSLKGGCTCSSESTLVKMPHCWKSHVMAHFKKLKRVAMKNGSLLMTSLVETHARIQRGGGGAGVRL